MRPRICVAVAVAMLAVTAMPDATSARERGARQTEQQQTEHRHVRRADCSGGNGAVGTVVGGAGGAVIGSEVIGGLGGAIIGGVGGALLGRHLDKQNTRNRAGCRR